MLLQVHIPAVSVKTDAEQMAVDEVLSLSISLSLSQLLFRSFVVGGVV